MVSGADLVRALKRAGWTVIRTRGSHVRLEYGTRKVSVPLHDPVKRGTLASILEDADMSADELRQLI